MPTPLKLGMVGGGLGAFIGPVHRMAATLDGEAVFVAGALSSTPDRSIASGRAIGLTDDRNYPTWREMLERELARDPADRIDAVVIVTPNDTHHAIAKAFAEAGFNVILDKPLTHTLGQALDLVRAADRSGVVFAVTYTYTGYPMVKHAARLVRDGALGEIRKVAVEYHQGWLATRLEESGQKQAAWRTDPARSGPAGALGDIGTHAENLVATVTGLELDSLCADVSTFVPGRAVDDDAAILLRFTNGARGTLSCSQVAAGEENNLAIRVYGDRAGLAWSQEHPNHLWLMPLDGPRQLISRGGPGSPAPHATRIPSGHPEGYIEAFANIYRGAFEAIRARREGRPPASPLAAEFPTVRDGARGIHFVECALRSARSGSTWTDARWSPPPPPPTTSPPPSPAATRPA